MKKAFLILTIIFLYCQCAFAQTGGVNFQGVARNSSGTVLANQKINLKFSILKTSELGTVEYTETKEATTNAQGVFSVVVGEVNATSFADIDWRLFPKFLKVEMDPAGGSSFVVMGTTRLQNVPYAYYANGVNASNIDGTVSIGKGGTGAADAATARANLGLVIGTNVQAPLTAGTDYLTPTGNAASASKLTTAKKINGVDFDGSADITIPTAADARTLSGTVSVDKGGTGATTAAAARANLGLVIGTNVQAPLTAGTDYLTPSGNAASASKLVTAKKINGVNFDGSSDIIVAADASTLSGTVSVSKGGTGLSVVGNSGQVLTSTGSGTLTWTSISGVPYTGATGPVDLGDYDLVVNNITIGAGGGNILGNTALGFAALNSNATGNRNTAVGESSLNHNLDGNSNTSVGVASLYNNNSGEFNVAVGDGALYNNVSGYGNTAIGVGSVYGNSTGNENTAVGFNSLTNPWIVSISGSKNTGVGTNSLNNVGSGSNNTAIGYSADIANEAFSNSTAIGNGAIANASNTVQLGNTSVIKVQTNGALTAGTVTYPNTHGTSGQVLSTTGSGTLTWTNIASILTVEASTLSGTLSVAKGGTGTPSLSGIVVGNGTNAMSGLNGIVSGETLTWNSNSSNWQLTGNSNLAIGNGAGMFGQGINAVAIGTNAGAAMQNVKSIAIGNNAGNFSQSSSSIAIGDNAAASYQGINAIAIGSNAGKNSQHRSSISIGENAGNLGQGIAAISIGPTSGMNSQSINAISIGNSAGTDSQGESSIAIGAGTAMNRQGLNAVAIGTGAGQNEQGVNSIAIGNSAGQDSQSTNSIIFNASGSVLNSPNPGLYVKPVRSNNISGGGLLQYNTSTSEIYKSNTLANVTITDKVIIGSLSETTTSAVLEANSTTKGFLPPRMTNTERNAIPSPNEGLMIWNITESELNVYNGSLWINMAGITNQSLAVGMKYQGGKIAYIFQSGDPGYDSQIQHGIIAAISDQSTGIKWGEYIDVNTTVDLIGSGLNNTNDIISSNGKNSNYAARIARTYKGGGYNDWFLPNLAELKKLYANRTLIGGFSGEKYWSSLEDWMNTGFLAYYQDFSYSSIYVSSVYKNQTYRVRAIRSF